jgi:hypothetical protein
MFRFNCTVLLSEVMHGPHHNWDVYHRMGVTAPFRDDKSPCPVLPTTVTQRFPPRQQL